MTAEPDLLPLPEWTKRDDLGGLVPSEVRAEMRAYTRANLAPLQAEIEALRELCGMAYQMAGYHDAPIEWLDALSDAANGTPLAEWRVQADDLGDVLLPYQPDTESPHIVMAERDRLQAEVELLKKGIVPRDDDMIVPVKLLDEINASGAEWKDRAERLAELLDQAYGYVPAGTLADQIHCALLRDQEEGHEQ